LYIFAYNFKIIKYIGIVGILNPRVKDMSYISAWGFSDCFAGGGWVCIVLPSHTPLHIMSGALYSGL